LKLRDLKNPLSGVLWVMSVKYNVVADYVADLQTKGRYTFTRDEAQKALSLSALALKKSLERLSKKKSIVLVHRGFYVVVPLEYRAKGVLPPEWFIRELMQFMNMDYYVGLLSAAAIHGAAHQQPQGFHVVIPRFQRDIRIGNLSIRFFKKAHLMSTPVVETKTSTGFIRVSDPASTAIDLVAYEARIGGLNRVITVLQELSESIKAEAVVRAAATEKNIAPVQRLGYILEKIGQVSLASSLEEWVSSHHPRPAPLQPGISRQGSLRNPKWNILVNTDLEGDL
jgi:predicted transcriptional regulator of viral defense system